MGKLSEGNPLVAHEVDSSVYKQSEELSKVFIASAYLYKKQEKQELCSVCHSKGTGEK